MKLYVGNISSDTTPDKLIEYFQSQCSLESNGNISVRDVTIPSRDHKKDSFRSYALVILNIKDFASAGNEIELIIKRTNGNEIDGMPIRVNPYRKKLKQKVNESADEVGTTFPKEQSSRQGKSDSITRYTIDDTVCPPMEMEVLQKVVIKHVSTCEKYISIRPLAEEFI